MFFAHVIASVIDSLFVTHCQIGKMLSSLAVYIVLEALLERDIGVRVLQRGLEAAARIQQFARQIW